jgi:serine/threonine-protein kinase RsbW
MIDVSCSFVASQEQTEKILIWIREQLRPLRLDKKTAYHVELCIEEVIVNIISYAYQESAGSVDITIKAVDNQLKFIVKDMGIAFNPISEFGSHDNTSSLEKRPVGGLGIYFLHELMDSVEYIRERGSNILIFEKKI